MNTIINSVPESVAAHLAEASRKFGLSSDHETQAKLQENWLNKKEAFENEMVELGMDEVGLFEISDERAALFLTYSGSLISVGPLKEGIRSLEYTSIGLRKDVPGSMNLDFMALADKAEIDKGLFFKDGPIKQTSPIFKIVVCPETLEVEEQEQIINEASTLIVDTFLDMNIEALR